MSNLRHEYTDFLQHSDNADGTMTVTAIARRSGVLHYRDPVGGDRYELVPPEFIDQRDDSGRPVMGFLAGAPNTNEHPNGIIRHTPDARKAVTVGSVKDEIHIYTDADGERAVKVRFDVSDPTTIAQIRNGQKTGVSMGYLCRVTEEQGTYRGRPYTHRQDGPLVIDHLAIVARPREPGALITHHDAEDAPIQLIRLDGCCAACDGTDGDTPAERRRRRLSKKTDAQEQVMIPLIFSDSIQASSEEQAQALWEEGFLDRVEMNGTYYYVSPDLAMDMASMGAIELHHDAFVKKAGIAKGGGKCGKGWVGIKGSCKRLPKGAYAPEAERSALQEFAQSKRAEKGMAKKPKAERYKASQTQSAKANKKAKLAEKLRAKETPEEVRNEREFTEIMAGKSLRGGAAVKAVKRERTAEARRRVLSNRLEMSGGGLDLDDLAGKSASDKIDAAKRRNREKRQKRYEATSLALKERMKNGKYAGKYEELMEQERVAPDGRAIYPKK